MIYAYYSIKFLNTNIFKKVVSLKFPSKQIQIVLKIVCSKIFIISYRYDQYLILGLLQAILGCHHNYVDLLLIMHNNNFQQSTNSLISNYIQLIYCNSRINHSLNEKMKKSINASNIRLSFYSYNDRELLTYIGFIRIFWDLTIVRSTNQCTFDLSFQLNAFHDMWAKDNEYYIIHF